MPEAECNLTISTSHTPRNESLIVRVSLFAANRRKRQSASVTFEGISQFPQTMSVAHYPGMDVTMQPSLKRPVSPQKRELPRRKRRKTTSVASSNGGLIVRKRRSPVVVHCCPFAILDAEKYADCCEHVFHSAIQTQDHVETCHRRGEYCPICGDTFVSAGEARAHIMRRSCELRTPLSIEGVPGDQMNRLCQWEPKTETSEEERWFEIWDILFPEKERPTNTRLSASHGA